MYDIANDIKEVRQSLDDASVQRATEMLQACPGQADADGPEVKVTTVGPEKPQPPVSPEKPTPPVTGGKLPPGTGGTGGGGTGGGGTGGGASADGPVPLPPGKTPAQTAVEDAVKDKLEAIKQPAHEPVDVDGHEDKPDHADKDHHGKPKGKDDVLEWLKEKEDARKAAAEKLYQEQLKEAEASAKAAREEANAAHKKLEGLTQSTDDDAVRKASEEYLKADAKADEWERKVDMLKFSHEHAKFDPDMKWTESPGETLARATGRIPVEEIKPEMGKLKEVIDGGGVALGKTDATLITGEVPPEMANVPRKVDVDIMPVIGEQTYGIDRVFGPDGQRFISVRNPWGDMQFDDGSFSSAEHIFSEAEYLEKFGVTAHISPFRQMHTQPHIEPVNPS